MSQQTNQTTSYTVRMHSPCGADQDITIEATDLDQLRTEADSETEDYLSEGEWGDDGASLDGWWEALDEDGERMTDEDGDDIMGSVTVEIEPDHAAKIKDACGGRHSSEWERCCGNDPDDHDWTSEGEGGCDQNPGVWSTGGTSMSFASHCKNCGLHRSEHHTGSQRNPGEHDTVKYTMPESWCGECEAEECGADKKLAKLDSDCSHDYADSLEELLTECGTVYQRHGISPEDSASVTCETIADQDFVRVADGCGSEWYGDVDACQSAIRNLWHAKSWQDGWDALGDGVTPPEESEDE